MVSVMDPLLLEMISILSDILAIAALLIIFYAAITAIGQFVFRELKGKTRHAYPLIGDHLTPGRY